MAKPRPNPTDADHTATLDAAVAQLGLVIDPAWRESILAHMKAISEAAQLALDFPLEDEVEPAPVYRP